VGRRLSRIAGAVALLLIAGLASGCNTVKQPGYNYPSLGDGMTILLFVVVPLSIFGTVALLAALPSLLARPRYRPGKGWDHDPLWFAGPNDPDDAIAAAEPGTVSKGGASAEW